MKTYNPKNIALAATVYLRDSCALHFYTHPRPLAAFSFYKIFTSGSPTSSGTSLVSLQANKNALCSCQPRTFHGSAAQPLSSAGGKLVAFLPFFPPRIVGPHLPSSLPFKVVVPWSPYRDAAHFKTEDALNSVTLRASLGSKVWEVFVDYVPSVADFSNRFPLRLDEFRTWNCALVTADRVGHILSSVTFTSFAKLPPLAIKVLPETKMRALVKKLALEIKCTQWAPNQIPTAEVHGRVLFREACLFWWLEFEAEFYASITEFPKDYKIYVYVHYRRS